MRAEIARVGRESQGKLIFGAKNKEQSRARLIRGQNCLTQLYEKIQARPIPFCNRFATKGLLSPK